MRELHYAVLYLGEQFMRVRVDDREANGVMRDIQYKWHEKDPSDFPPSKWADAIHGELEFQRGEAQRGSVEAKFRDAAQKEGK
jgi:hypothetical protein